MVTSNKNDQAEKYKHQGQEFEEELGKNVYSYQWRDYDPAIARFNKIDRFAEKYISHSPYAFTKNNPILYREIAGDSIRDADNVVRDFRSNINTQITNINQILANENYNFAALQTNREAVTQFRNELNGILGELDALENSEQVYDVAIDPNFSAREGGVTFNNEDNSVSIRVGRGANVDVVSQELLHGYQFQTGKLSISYDNSAYGTLYDISDETATYRREHLVGQGVAGLQTRNNITNASTRAAGARQIPPLYIGLPDRPINLQSPEGVSLQVTNALIKSLNQQSQGGRSGSGNHPFTHTPSEVFIGWDR